MSNGNRPPRASHRITEPQTTIARRLRARIADGARAAPTAEQWDAIRRSLFAGDPLMDAVVAWMVAAGVRATKPLFDAALDHGIASVPDAPDVLREIGRAHV